MSTTSHQEVIQMAAMHRNQAKIPVLLPVDLLEAVQKEAKETDRSVCAVVRMALKRHLAAS